MLQFPLRNSLPNDKSLGWFKLKELTDNKINVTDQVKFGFGYMENIVVTSIFSFSYNFFKSPISQGRYCVVKNKPFFMGCKFTAFADDNFYVAKMVQFFSDSLEDVVGQGVTFIFSFSYNIFKRYLLETQ